MIRKATLQFGCKYLGYLNNTKEEKTREYFFQEHRPPIVKRTFTFQDITSCHGATMFPATPKEVELCERYIKHVQTWNNLMNVLYSYVKDIPDGDMKMLAKSLKETEEERKQKEKELNEEYVREHPCPEDLEWYEKEKYEFDLMKSVQEKLDYEFVHLAERTKYLIQSEEDRVYAETLPSERGNPYGLPRPLPFLKQRGNLFGTLEDRIIENIAIDRDKMRYGQIKWWLHHWNEVKKTDIVLILDKMFKTFEMRIELKEDVC